MFLIPKKANKKCTTSLFLTIHTPSCCHAFPSWGRLRAPLPLQELLRAVQPLKFNAFSKN